MRCCIRTYANRVESNGSGAIFGFEVVSKENISKYEDGISHREFLELEGISVSKNDYFNDKDNQSLSNLSSAIASKSKPINDDVQLQTTVLNDISSQYNATVEAMNKFVQKFHSILQEILRAL